MTDRNEVSEPSFSLFACRFHFRAVDTLYFPPGKAGNIVRGTFGSIFRKLVCTQDCRGAENCPHRTQCPYARLFEPVALGGSPSGLGDWPRPFVFRAGSLDGRSVAIGESFQFDVHLFDLDADSLRYFILAFAQFADAGLGPRRGKARLVSVVMLNARSEEAVTIYNNETFLSPSALQPIVISLRLGPEPVSRIRVEFLAPTEIKQNGHILDRPLFGSLFRRLVSRLSDLRKFYGAGALEIDFAGMGRRSDEVTLLTSALTHVHSERVSGHTGQRHAIGGFVGSAEYEGTLSEFLPFLIAGYWTGIGRQTVWGKGVIRTSVL